MSDNKPCRTPIHVVPVVAEELVVSKQQVETGKVRISTPVHERTVQVDEACFREEVQVVHVPVNRFIDAPVEVRQDGETTVVPVVEERLVLVRRLFLKEEIHITKRRVEDRVVQDVTLRYQDVEVRRSDPS